MVRFDRQLSRERVSLQVMRGSGGGVEGADRKISCKVGLGIQSGKGKGNLRQKHAGGTKAD